MANRTKLGIDLSNFTKKGKTIYQINFMQNKIQIYKSGQN
jgi:hypothetical protein